MLDSTASSDSSSELDNLIQDFDNLAAGLEGLPSSSRLANADADQVYSLAYHFLEQGHFQAALQYFSLLCFYKPTHVDYLTGAAICQRMLENYAEALKIYSFLAVTDDENPQHTLAIAECLLLQKEVQEARATVAMVLRYCEQNPAKASNTAKVQSRAQAISQWIAAEIETTAVA